VTITAKLTKGITGEPLANKEVDFNDYNSDFIGSNMTNSYGEAQIKYQVPLQAKTYRVSAHFNAKKSTVVVILQHILLQQITFTYNLDILNNPNI
jgi:hypothetical protein